MKKIFLLTLLSCSISKVNAQEYYSDSLALKYKAVLDTLPIIGYKKNIPILALSCIYPFTFALGFNADEYEIKGKRYFSNKRLEPYFTALNDPIVIDNYRYHRISRPAYLSSVPLGFASFFGGFAILLSTSMGKRNPNAPQRNTKNYEATGAGLMVLGVGTFGAGIVLRIKSFSKMHAARKRYNQLIIDNAIK